MSRIWRGISGLERSNLNLRHLNSQSAMFEGDFHSNRIQINDFQRHLLTFGSALMSLLDPHRADMIACLSETTGETAIKHMLGKMENSSEGSRILSDRPRINSKTVDLDKLKRLPEDTLGKIYSNFLEVNVSQSNKSCLIRDVTGRFYSKPSSKVTPDSRMTVQFLDDANTAYVLQRYREVHDLFHAVLGMPTNMLGEVTVKWVEAIQTKLPMCIGGAIFGPVRLKPKHRHLYRTVYLPWAINTGIKSEFILNVYFEERWEQPFSDLQKELKIENLVTPKNPT